MNASAQPAALGIPAGHFPPSPVAAGHVAGVPRRIRAWFDGVTVLDTFRALYVWDHPFYPQFQIPAADVDASLLVDDGVVEEGPHGTVAVRSLVHGDRRADAAARFLQSPTDPALADTYRFDWAAMDAWFEEDEQVFGHPRSPYVRVDALRSTRHVRVELNGVVVAESDAPVAVVETGLPTRWYLDRSAVNWAHMVDSETRTLCPYKGRTTGYWSVQAGGRTRRDVAWSYDFPTRQLTPVAGLVAFLDEKIDVFVDGVLTRTG
jgi:uncharacterized protein (DUF427 family)